MQFKIIPQKKSLDIHISKSSGENIKVSKKNKKVMENSSELSLESEKVYSDEHYKAYSMSKDKNLFEGVIEKMMIESCMDETFKPYIDEVRKIIDTQMPPHKKRFAILCTLDKNRNLMRKAKVYNQKSVTKMEHIKDYVQILRQYVKVSEVEKKKFGEVMTPIDLVKEMLGKLPKEVWSNPDLKWLDPCNGVGPFGAMVVAGLMKGLAEWEPDENKRYRHILENMVYVCELQPKNMFLWMCMMDPVDKYGLNIYCGSFLDEGFDKHMKEVWGVDKFDVVVGNPPYKSGEHINFFNKSFEILKKSGHIVFIHPSTPFINRKPSNDDKKTKEIKNIISNFKSSIKLIDGNKIFTNAGFFTPLSITIVKKENNNNNNIEVIFSHIDDTNNKINLYDTIDKIYIHGNDIVLSIKDKILSKMETSIEEKLYRNGNTANKYIKINRISGHPPKAGEKMINPDFFQLLYKKDENDYSDIITQNPIGKRNDGNQFNELIINSDAEIPNIHNYLLSKRARFCLSLYKNSANILSDLKAVPYLDFSKEWTDEKFDSFFGLSKEEIDFIENYIPNWYEKDFINK